MDITDLQTEIWDRYATSVHTRSNPLSAVPAGVRLEDAVLADADAIAKIHVNSWRVAYKQYVPAPVLENISLEQRAAMWKRSIDPGYRGARVVVARGDGSPSGFIAFGPLRGGPARCGEVYSLYVDPQNLRAGIGTALLECAMKYLASQALCQVFLWVLADNIPARAFYSSFGWRDTGAFREEPVGGASLREAQMCVELT